MSDMQRYYPHKPLETIPCGCDDSVAVVTLADAEAAIAAAEQRGIQKALIAWQEAEPLHDMEVLAAAVQRVEALRGRPWLYANEVIAAIKGGSDE